MASSLHQGPVKLLVSYIIIDIISIALVILRFYAIHIRGRKTRLHDHLCILSLVALVAYSICTLIGTVDGGIGLHIWEVPPTQLVIGFKSFFASQFFWAISIASFRLSILLLYIELFAVSRFFHWAAWGCTALVCAFFVGSIATTLALCQPVALNWDKSITNGHCGDEGTAELAAAAFNVALDVVIVALPLPVVWKLRLPTHKKVGISITFGLGLGISAINLARVYKVLTCSLTDFTYCTLDSAILTVAEMGVGIAVACVPTLAPLFRHRAETAKNMSAKQLVDGHVRLRSLENMSDSTKDISTASQTRTINLDYDNRQFDYKASARHLPSQVHHAVQTGLKLQYANGIGVQREFVVTTSSHGRSFPK